MTQSFARTFILAGAILGAAVAPAAAQDVPPRSGRSLVPADFPRWDATGSLGLLVVSAADTGVSWDGWEQKADYRLDVGRYWTPHLKTEVAFSTSNPSRDYETVRLVVPGVAAAFAYDEVDRQLYTVAPALTWQFFENNFVHPYVSGGVKIGILQEHRYRTGDHPTLGCHQLFGAGRRRAAHPAAGTALRRRRLQVLHLAVGVRAHRSARGVQPGRRPAGVDDGRRRRRFLKG